MTIAGKPAQLICVYVERRMQFGIVPQVLSIDFFGRALDDGKKVVGRLAALDRRFLAKAIARAGDRL